MIRIQVAFYSPLGSGEGKSVPPEWPPINGSLEEREKKESGVANFWGDTSRTFNQTVTLFILIQVSKWFTYQVLSRLMIIFQKTIVKTWPVHVDGLPRRWWRAKDVFIEGGRESWLEALLPGRMWGHVGGATNIIMEGDIYCRLLGYGSLRRVVGTEKSGQFDTWAAKKTENLERLRFFIYLVLSWCLSSSVYDKTSEYLAFFFQQHNRLISHSERAAA